MSLQQQQLNQRTPGQQQNSQPMRKTATSMMQPSITRPQDFHFDSFTTSTAATPIQPSGGDTELSDIVNSVIDLLPEYQGTNLLSGILPETSSSQPSQQPQNQEEMAINAITKSLMQIESTGAFNSSPPAYSMHNVNTSSQVSVFRKFEFFVPGLTIFSLLLTSSRVFHHHRCTHNEEPLSEIPPAIQPAHRNRLQPCGFSSNSKCNVKRYFSNSKRNVCCNNNRNNRSLCQSMLPPMPNNYVSLSRNSARNKMSFVILYLTPHCFHRYESGNVEL